MSDNWNLPDNPVSTQTSGTQGKAPWHFLGIGATSSLVLVGIWLFLRPSGDFIITGNLIFWVLSMVAYLGPFMLFAIGDMKARSASIFYYTNPKTVSLVRGIYLAFGLVLSTVFVYGAADELSRFMNTVN